MIKYIFDGDNMSHYIEYCRICGIVIATCRCASKDKEVRYSICDKCKGVNFPKKEIKE
jgi:hypothetical protein